MPNVPKLRVGLVFDDSLDGSDGVAQYVKTVGGWLSGQGHHVVYLAGQSKTDNLFGGRVYSLSRNIGVRFNGNRLSMPLLPRRRLMNEVLKHEKLDVLHVMLPCSPLMAGRLIAAADETTAVVGTFHIFPAGWLSRAGSRLLKLALRPTMKRFQAVVSVSRPAQEFARGAYGIKSDVLPNPLRLEAFQTCKNHEQAETIVFLGRLVARKGCRQLIKAFHRLSDEIPDARLIIAGRGPQRRRLEKRADSLGISRRVTFVGYVDEAAKAELLASAAVACFPSLYGESFGIVLLEAMAAGAGAVLGGDNPGYRSVLGGQPELLVDPRDEAVFAIRLKRLLLDKNLRAEVHRWQRSAVKQYDIKRVGPILEELYRSSIDKADRKSHNKHHGKP